MNSLADFLLDDYERRAIDVASGTSLLNSLADFLFDDYERRAQH